MDTQDGILGTNMYAYCQGDPVNRYDPTGTDYSLTMAFFTIGGPIALAEPTFFGEVIYVLGLIGVSIYDTIKMVGMENIPKVFELVNTVGVDTIVNFMANAPDAARIFTDLISNIGTASPPPPGDPNHLQNIFSSIKKAPGYDPSFTQIQNGLKTYNINNKELLEKLNHYGSGWKKVYQDGWLNGEKVSYHYFRSKSGQIFDFKVIYGRWSN